MLPVFGQGSSAADAQSPGAVSAGDKAPSYEVVSIKPHKPGEAGSGMRTLPDGMEWWNISMYSLVQAAYDIEMEDQISGLPGWAKSETYDIVAKVDAQTVERWKHLSEKQQWAEEEPMIRSILEERCQFKAHEETRELPVYDLVIAKGGLKMKEAVASENASESMYRGRLVAKGMQVDAIVTGFTNSVGRLIVDKTGLGEKKFDFELRWTPDGQQAADDSADAPQLSTALKEQLGLKLVPAKGPVPVVVIEHMDRPSPN
ncbi:TIGR03435 family protein [Acidicapsa dinghuensis]|uniref:TIGR03435 family protein n=1 Tax=Acidicapsa dinghuensis TaxID=2218256 RepID=A0ABW1EHD2_9BACT|nr:TIGR03435 family protein [Acidicapsa dinghuensis]